mgnify:CR=1 FL=1
MERFARTKLIIGETGLQKLSRAKVAVFGIGGVGGAACEALARSGIGTLVLVDHDVVDITNINRQIVALGSTLGRPKVEVMAERVRDINPDCRVIAYREFYDERRSDELLPCDLDYVVDAIDSVPSKVSLIAQCRKRGISVVSAMGAGNKLDPTQLQVTDISQTHTCPLAKAVRLGLRKLGVREGVPVVFSTERPRRLVPGRTPGSIAFVPPVVGMIMASIVVRDLLQESDSGGSLPADG